MDSRRKHRTRWDRRSGGIPPPGSHAQKLGEQVSSMSAKIKELECALAAAHLQLRAGSNPPDDAGDRTDRNPDWGPAGQRRSYGVNSGSLAIDQEGVSRYYGDTASSEVRPWHCSRRRHCLNHMRCSISQAFFLYVLQTLSPQRESHAMILGSRLVLYLSPAGRQAAQSPPRNHRRDLGPRPGARNYGYQPVDSGRPSHLSAAA